MQDIVPELLDKIQQQFTRDLNNNSNIKNIYTKINNGTATHIDVHKFAIETGKTLADSFNKYITIESLPDGRMYYNIAERILNPTLGNNYELIDKALETVQTDLNKKAGFGLKGIRTPLNQGRIDGFIERLSLEENFKDVKWILDEPVINFSQSIVDAGIANNVDFQARSGLTPTVTRIVTGHKPCAWCRGLAGTYEYPDVPEDVYRRHDNCRCLVEYDPGNNKKQDVWTKQWRDPKEKEKIEHRKTIGL